VEVQLYTEEHLCESSLNCSLSARPHNHILGSTWYLLIMAALDIKVIFDTNCVFDMIIDTTEVGTLVQIPAGWHCIIEQLSYTTLTNKFTLT